MNLHSWLAAVFVLLALTGCALVAPGQGQVSVPSYPHDNGLDMRNGMIAGRSNQT